MWIAKGFTKERFRGSGKFVRALRIDFAELISWSDGRFMIERLFKIPAPWTCSPDFIKILQELEWSGNLIGLMLLKQKAPPTGGRAF